MSTKAGMSRNSSSAPLLHSLYSVLNLCIQAFCDNLLESRIKIQKAANAVGTLPQVRHPFTQHKFLLNHILQTTSAEPFFSALPEELAAALAQVSALNEELFSLREVRPIPISTHSLLIVSLTGPPAR